MRAGSGSLSALSEWWHDRMLGAIPDGVPRLCPRLCPALLSISKIKDVALFRRPIRTSSLSYPLTTCDQHCAHWVAGEARAMCYYGSTVYVSRIIYWSEKRSNASEAQRHRGAETNLAWPGAPRNGMAPLVDPRAAGWLCTMTVKGQEPW